MELIKSGTNIDFMKWRRVAIVGSLVLNLLSITFAFYPGIKWGIDFSGGTEVQVRFKKTMDVPDLRAALAEVELADDSVQRFGNEADNEFLIKVQNTNFTSSEDLAAAQGVLTERFGTKVSDFKASEDGAHLKVRRDTSVSADQIQEALNRFGSLEVTEDAVDREFVSIQFSDPSRRISELLSKSLEPGSFEVVRVDSVGPKVGAELRSQGVMAVFFSLVLMLVYIAFRFSTEFAPGAIICLFHDVLIANGVLILAGADFNTGTIAALLTVVGYSLNDTIVLFDRVRENQLRYRGMPYEKLINKSINECLSRTIMTSGATFLVIIILMILGGPTLFDFSLALFVGIIAGTYSSIYIAAPLVIWTRDLLGVTDEPEGEPTPTAVSKSPAR